jgi:hypothetical protein
MGLNSNLESLVRPELLKQKQRILEAGDAVMDYIEKAIYLQIGIN